MSLEKFWEVVGETVVAGMVDALVMVDRFVKDLKDGTVLESCNTLANDSNNAMNTTRCFGEIWMEIVILLYVCLFVRAC